MLLYMAAMQEDSLNDAPLAEIAPGIIEDEARGFPRSRYAGHLPAGPDHPRLPGRRANRLSRASSLKLKTALAHGRWVPL